MEQGWDEDVKRFFRKILYSISYGLFWMLSFVGIGLYAGLAYWNNWQPIVVISFYAIMGVTLFFLVRYYFRVWKK
jgi:hypothetical protein